MFTHPKSEMDPLATTTCDQFPFESERLRIRRLKEEDFSALYAYRNDALVAKYQSWTDKSREEIRALINEKPTLGTINEWFTFAIALKETDKLIGECAFCINQTFPQQAEMGITLSKEAQGKFYAGEAITAILNFLFNTLRVEDIIFITYLENVSCIKLISKLSASHQIDPKEAKDNEKYRHFGLKENETIFSVSKIEWIKNKQLSLEKKPSSPSKN